MPFINGRYHVNPIMGQALEAAREAEAALLALQQKASRNLGNASGNSSRDSSGESDANSAGDEFGDAEDSANAASPASQGPIHRVEIEITQLTPPQSGRAARGYVARVHRAAPSSPVVIPRSEATRNLASGGGTVPETHVFADHGDLVNFLHDALATDSPQR
jgi:hypothetical protein